MDDRASRQEPERDPGADLNRSNAGKPSSRPKLSIALIGLVAIGSIGCMCAFIFTLVVI